METVLQGKNFSFVNKREPVNENIDHVSSYTYLIYTQIGLKLLFLFLDTVLFFTLWI